MKKVYAIFTKDQDGEIWLDSIRTNETQALLIADILKDQGLAVAVNTIKINELAYLKINSSNDLTFSSYELSVQGTK